MWSESKKHSGASDSRVLHDVENVTYSFTVFSLIAPKGLHEYNEDGEIYGERVLMGYVGNLQRAEQNLMQEHANRNAAIAAAAKGVQEAQVRYESRIRLAEKVIEEAEKPFKKPLATYSEVKLFADRVSDGEIEILLLEGVKATVDTSGNRAYIGDKRNLFVTINSSSGRRITVKGDPDREEKAREFAALVMNTAAVAPECVADREAGYPRLRAQLEAARADTRELDAARAAYEAAVNDPSVQQAQLVLDDLKANAPQNELAAYEDAKRRKRYQHRVIAIAVILLAFLLLVAMVTCAVATIR